MLLVIELKGPHNEKWVTKYDHDLAAQLVVELIEKYDIWQKTMVSSFVPLLIDNVHRVTKDYYQKFYIQSLVNTRGIEENYDTPKSMSGVCIAFDYATSDIVTKVH